jgi:hypothetical protein
MSTSSERQYIEANALSPRRMQEIRSKFEQSTDDPHPKSPRSPRSPNVKLSPRFIHTENPVSPVSPRQESKKAPKFEVKLTDMKSDSKNKSLINTAAKEGSTTHEDLLKLEHNKRF